MTEDTIALWINNINDKGIEKLMEETGYLESERVQFGRNFAKLTNDGRACLLMRYGIGDFEPHSYREIAKRISGHPQKAHFLVQRSISFLQLSKHRYRTTERFASRVLWSPANPHLGDNNTIECLGLSKKLYNRLLKMGAHTIADARKKVQELPVGKRHRTELRACLRNFDEVNNAKCQKAEESISNSSCGSG